MSSKTLYRSSGVALLIGGLLTLVFITMLYEIFTANDARMYTQLQSPGLHSPWWLLLNLMGILGSVLILIGLPAVYAYQRKDQFPCQQKRTRLSFVVPLRRVGIRGM